MNVFNPAQFRAQFPALQDAGVYLDSAATALKPEAVVEATRQFYSLSAGNVHRSQFAEAQRLTARYEAAREKVAQLLNASDDKNIVWTRGTTESINMVAQCYARPRLQPGDEIIVSVAEHHANLVPWLMVAQQTGAKVVKLPLNAQRLPNVDLLPELITPRSRILALCQMSNVTGGCRIWRERLLLLIQPGWWLWLMVLRGRCISPRMFSNWILISMLFQVTNCMARQASACCMANQNCWKRCRPGWAAAKWFTK